MKKLGLIGGLSWQSTVEYYSTINSMVQQRRGGNQAAELLLHSLNFGEVEKKQASGDWKFLADLLVQAALGLQAQGAEGIMICANTMHKVAPEVIKTIQVPFIHIIDSMGVAIRARGIQEIALLGTRFTMREDFYKNYLLEKYKIRTLVPEERDIDFIHHSIHHELMANVFKFDTKKRFQDIIRGLKVKGAEGVILGCTEIPLLLQPEDCEIPSFDSMLIHSQAAVDFHLSN